MNKLKHLGRRMKYVRNYYELPITQIAEFLEISPEEYKSMENGNKSKISIFLLEKLCNLYFIDEEWLIEGKGKFNPNKKNNFLYNQIRFYNKGDN